MKRKLPPLNTLRAFEAAARHLSFTRASHELHVTHGAVSQAIKTLESYYEQPLFVRSKGKVSLNSVGKRLLPVISEALDKIERVGSRLNDAETEVLTIQLTAAFAAQWLIPRLSDFQQHFPKLTIRLLPSHSFSGFQNRDADVAIRYGTVNVPGVVAEKLFDVDTFAACAPSLLEGERALQTPADLVQFTLIHDDDGEAWAGLFEEAGVAGPCSSSKELYYADASLALQAAVEGEGVIVAGSILAARDLAAGRLTIPFNTFVRKRNAYYLHLPEQYDSAGEAEEKVQAFCHWLHRQVQDYLKEEQALDIYLASPESTVTGG